MEAPGFFVFMVESYPFRKLKYEYGHPMMQRQHRVLFCPTEQKHYRFIGTFIKDFTKIEQMSCNALNFVAK